MVYGSAGGGVALDVTSGALLPSTVVDNQIFIVTSTPVNEYYVTLEQPLMPASGDVWVKIGASTITEIILNDTNPYFALSFLVSYQYNGSTWAYVPAYVGMSGQWVLMAPPAQPLEDMSWADISSVSTMGLASSYWSVGDTKGITIDNTPYTVQIAGFNHDDLADGSGKAGVTFTLQNCLNTTYALNSSPTNANGWGGCSLRTTLQSTIFNQIESNLRNVIKTVNKTACVGGGSTNVSTYADNLFLFAEIEVFGVLKYSAPGEGTQYELFTTSSERIKDVNGAPAGWWLRSAYAQNAQAFCFVNATGGQDAVPANSPYGIAFGFCV